MTNVESIVKSLPTEVVRAIRLTLVVAVVTGLIYPLVITGISQVVFHDQANGSLITKNGQVVGSKLIGQNFTDPKYFFGRPSATVNASDATKSDPYNAQNSAGSNLAPSNKALIDRVSKAVAKIRKENNLPPNYPLPADAVTNPDHAPEHDGSHCGSCTRCIDVCPTGAIVAPYRVDARRCISYLTIELKGSIPEEMRPLIGNRVYGCDDCQLVCPWNKFAQAAPVADFDVRHGLDRASLVTLFGWSALDFDERMQGSAIRRIGHERWLRNIAVAMGNALRSPTLDANERLEIHNALNARAADASELVREHVEWALRQEA